jgi:S-DNA-T family DNA segregation ATPase FtsK/SpoIIIE
MPSVSILSVPEQTQSTEPNYSNIIENLFLRYGTPCTVVRLFIGPAVVSYHFDLHDPLDSLKIKKLITPISCALRVANVKILPSPYSHFCIEIPRANREIVHFRDVLLTNAFWESPSPLTAVLGQSSDGSPVIVDLAKMPHTLIAGSTGSGKSVALNTIIASLLFKSAPSTLAIVLIDTKKTEFTIYEGLPHLPCEVITTPSLACRALRLICNRMDQRYIDMASNGISDVTNSDKYGRMLIVIDELADLMLTCKTDIERYLVRIAQLGRAAGFHLLLATQSPRVSVITGLISANVNGRIALKTSTGRESIITLNHQGAETLLGKGDAFLKSPEFFDELRLQVAYISKQDIEATVNYWKTNKS